VKKIFVLVLLLIATPGWAVTLDWTDNSTTEDGFAIEQLVSGGWTEVARVITDVITYSDGDTEGCYRVRAYREDGVNTYYSDYTNTACKLNAPVTLVIQ